MQVEVGAVVEGTVTGITKFGAFVSLPDGRSGLVHISEIANTYVNDVNEFLKLGDKVKVRVLAVTPDGKINLSIKKASIFTKLVIAALMVYALISLVVVHQRTAQLQDRAAALQQQVSEMTQSNAELQYQIDHSDDDDMRESVAREKLGLVKPGEKIFYDTSD